MKSIFLHIGPHKTGTTTIQEGLNIHRDMLLRYDFLVPKTGQVFSTNAGQHNLARELRGDDRFNVQKGTWKELLNEINKSNTENVILSSEGFSLLPLEKINELRNYLTGFLVKIIVYVRRQDLVLQSYWAEVTKSGDYEHGNKDFDVWMDKYDFENRNGNYQKLLDKWSSVFGKENIIVRVLEKNQLNGSLFNDFLSTCGIKSPEKFSNPADKNKSPGIKVIRLIQEFKKRLAGNMDKDERNMLYAMIIDYGNLAGWNEGKWTLINRQTYDKINDRYETSNNAVAKDFFGRDQLFFEDYNENEFADFSMNDFSNDELISLITYIISQNLAENRHLKIQLALIHSSRGWRVLEKLQEVKRTLKRK